MITDNAANVILPTALEWIRMEPSICFFPTGSRYLGCHTKISDYDFFTLYSEETKTALNKAGFKIEKAGVYSDPLTSEVYRKENVHVQLVSSVIIKQTLQTVLGPELRAVYPNKRQARMIWELGYRCFMAGKELHDV